MSTIWYARNVGDYQRKTRHLSMLEHGAYTMLLDWYYANDRAPDASADVLHRICMAFAPAEQAAVQSVLKQFFELRDGRWYNDRCEEELLKRRDISQKRVGAAEAKHAKARAIADAKAAADAPALADTSTTTTTVREEREAKASLVRSFAEFWDAYPHRGQKRNRKGALARFTRAVKSGVPEQLIVDGARRAHSDPRVKSGYARDPTTWLHQEGWADEIDPNIHTLQSRRRQDGPGLDDHLDALKTHLAVNRI